MKKILLSSLAALCCWLPLQGEILGVSVMWNPVMCNVDCAKLLEKHFAAIRGVQSIQMDYANGRATLHWKPGFPFSYSSIDLAARQVGPSMDEVRLKARGTITHAGALFYLISSGDNTRIELFNYPAPSSTQYIEYNNIGSYTLNPDMQQQLLAAENSGAIVTAEGRLFEPEVGSLKLIIEHFNVSNQPRDPNNPNQTDTPPAMPNTMTNYQNAAYLPPPGQQMNNNYLIQQSPYEQSSAYPNLNQTPYYNPSPSSNYYAPYRNSNPNFTPYTSTPNNSYMYEAPDPNFRNYAAPINNASSYYPSDYLQNSYPNQSPYQSPRNYPMPDRRSATPRSSYPVIQPLPPLNSLKPLNPV